MTSGNAAAQDWRIDIREITPDRVRSVATVSSRSSAAVQRHHQSPDMSPAHAAREASAQRRAYAVLDHGLEKAVTCPAGAGGVSYLPTMAGTTRAACRA